jgi:CHASE1-domain containing sensor protein
VTLLAATYALAGALGLVLAVPPGYATIVWPASGIAIGVLLLHGARLWPGVLIGSFLLNAYHSDAFADSHWHEPKLLAAAAIAIGATIQSLVARGLIARVVGVPLRFESLGQVFFALALAGPVSCLIAATIGVGALWLLAIIGTTEVPINWLAWWSGDTLGVVLFTPLVLLAAGERRRLKWRAQPVGRLPLAGMLLLLLPLALTLYAWKSTTENEYQRSQAKFELLTTESEKAIQNRLGSYGNALLGATAFVQGSSEITRQDWRTYVQTIRTKENFPGLNGIGWVRPVEPGAVAGFVTAMRRGGAPDFFVHPLPITTTSYVISLVEPDEENHAALGLNIAFERNRREAAELARDTGTIAITRRIALIHDEQRTPGFLLLYPIYDLGMAMNTVADRRAALRGWTHAAFFANKFFGGLEEGKSSAYRLSVYDGAELSAKALIFRNDARSAALPEFHREVKLKVMQREWLLVWDSSPAFEAAERSSNHLYILLGGLLFTALLTLLLIVVAVRRAEHMEKMVGERRFAVPLLVFMVLAGASALLYMQLL